MGIEISESLLGVSPEAGGGRPVGLGLIGYGNIGREVYAYHRRRRDYARVVRIGRRRLQADAPASVQPIIAPPADVIADPTVQIVIELTGDPQAGAQYIVDAIAAGKHVVTANKEALSRDWRDIMNAARREGVSVGFEATVGGGMPIVRAMQRHVACDEVEGFAGILNGTCNFILTRMMEYIERRLDDDAVQRRSLPLEEALAHAQRRGFAEPVPTNDINGFDTKYKMAILANLAFETTFDPAAISCEGIWDQRQRILASDLYFLQHPRYLDGKYALKLVGVAQRRDGKATLRVHPALIDKRGPFADLAAVHENFNGIVIHGRRLGTQFIKGLGAGPRPTSVSVASDIREIATGILRADGGPPVPAAGRPTRAGDVRTVRTRGYIRSVSPDVKGIYARKLEILARHRVSVQSVVNVKEFVYGRSMPDYIEIDPAPDGAVLAALEEFRSLRGVSDPMYFRLLEL